MDLMLVISLILSLIMLLIVTHYKTDLFYIKLPSLSSFYYFMYLIIFISSVVVFFQSTYSVRYNYLFMMYIGAIGFPIGIIMSSILMRYRRKEGRNYNIQDIEQSGIDKRSKMTFDILFIASIALIILYISQVRSIPLFYMLKGGTDSMEFAMMRESSFKLLNSRLVYLYVWNRSVILPFLAMYSFCQYHSSKNSKWRNRFILSLPIALFNAGFSGAEAPVAEIILMVIFVYYIAKKGKIKKNQLITLFFLAFSYTFILPIIMGSSNQTILSVIINQITKNVQRFSYDTAVRLQEYVRIFSDSGIGYLYGRGNSITALLTGQSLFNIPNYVFRDLFPNHLASGHANAPFVGYLYADFGLLGVFIGTLIMGFIIQTIQIGFYRKPKSILNIVIYAFLINAFRKLLSTQPTTVLVTHGVILIMYFPLLFKLSMDLFSPYFRHRSVLKR